MSATSSNTGFIVWGFDKNAYGPMDLPDLITWVKEDRVTASTWVFVPKVCVWQRAADVPELQIYFQAKCHASPSGVEPLQSVRGLDPRALRRVKLLSYLTDDQLGRFAQFMELVRLPQGAVVVRQGDIGDSMYVILEGELSVRMNVAGQQTVLATLAVGDFFGDIALFDRGPRSADVMADTTCVLLRISAAAFDQLSREAPDLATPFLRAVGKTLTARIRAGNKHLGEAVKFAHALE